MTAWKTQVHHNTKPVLPAIIAQYYARMTAWKTRVHHNTKNSN